MTFYRNAEATGFAFVRSSFSGGNGDNCVECAAGARDEIVVRDSKDPQGPGHGHPKAAFDAFLAAVANDALVPVA
ncbi:DUF397 domain-containing protein [Kitasatospora cineracea]|uniref:DUF397 domain-containing protein n=1 Tax=Kitasatospora cineracea TaxID=88074 RepID=UPI0036C1D1C0